MNILDFQYLAQNSDTLEKSDSLPSKQVSFTIKETDTSLKKTLKDTTYAGGKAALQQSSLAVPEKQDIKGADFQQEKYVPEFPEPLPSNALKDWMEFTDSHSPSNDLQVFSSVPALQPSFRKEVQRNQILPDWFFLLFLSGLLILSIARMLYERYFNRVLMALTNEYQALSLHKSRNLFTSQIFFLLLLNFVLIAPLAIYLLLNREGGEYVGRVVTVIGLSAVAGGIIILRRVLLYITGELFQSNRVLGEYYFFVRNFYVKIGLVLLPFVFLGAYFRALSPGVFLTAAAVLVGLLYLERLYRGWRTASRYHVPKFYLILYLCALEILPVLIGYKIVRDLTGM